MYKLIIILFLINSLNLIAADISGTVRSGSESGDLLSGVTIRIEGTAYGAVSKQDGAFRIKTILKEGSYNLIASMIGYNTEKVKMNVFGGANVENILIILNEQPLQMGEVVVSANKRIQAVQDVPISISVMDSRQIRQRNPRQLNEALEYIPGVSMNQDHVSIRGSSGFAFGTGSRVALMIDGLPLLGGDGGDIKFDMIPMKEIERIEVVKGAGSALYGTSAIGGVISVITKEPANKTNMSANLFSGFYTEPRYDSWKYSDSPHKLYGADLGFSKKLNGLGLLLSGTYTRDEGYRLYDDADRGSFFSKISYDFSPLTKLTFIGNYSATDKTDWVYWNSLDSATRPPTGTDQGIRLYSDRLVMAVKLSQIFNAKHFLNINANIFKTHFENTFDVNHGDYRQSNATQYNAELQMNSLPESNIIVTYGLNYTYNNVESATYGTNNQQIVSAYAQGEYSGISDLIMTFGARFDNENTSGATEKHNEFSPKIGISYKAPFETKLRFSAGWGFRAASVGERYASVEFQGFNVMPNPGLNSERSFSLEIGANHDFEIAGFPLNLDIAGFRNELYDLIEPAFVSETSADIMFQNVTRAEILGVEIGLKSLLFNILGFETGMTAIDPKDINSNKTLKYRSKFIWYSRAVLPLGPVELQADYRYLSKIENIDEELRLQVEDYDARVPVHIVDARIILNLHKISEVPINITLNSKNIMDYYYTEMVGNLAPTRYIGLQIEYQMQ